MELALTKSKIKLPFGVSKAIRKTIQKLTPKSLPFQNFNVKKMPYMPNPKKKNFEKMPYELPDDSDRYQGRFDIKKIKGEKMGTSTRTKDLEYKQPAWLTKILDEPVVDKSARALRRQKVMEQLGQEMKKPGAPKKQIRGLIRTGRAHQDSQLNKLEP